MAKPEHLRSIKISISLPRLMLADAATVQIICRKSTLSALIQDALSEKIAATLPTPAGNRSLSPAPSPRGSVPLDKVAQ